MNIRALNRIASEALLSNRRVKAIVVATLCAAELGCFERPRPVPDATRESIAPPTVAPVAETNRADASTAPTPAGHGTPAPTPSAKATSEQPDRTPVQLQGAYLAAKEFSDKVEVIYDLGDIDTPDAIYTLMRLFQVETDDDLKLEMIDATDRMEEQVEATLAFLGVALAPNQSAEVREAATSLLLGIDDPRAIRVWTLLLKDPDPERREMAQEQIEELRSLNQN